MTYRKSVLRVEYGNGQVKYFASVMAYKKFKVSHADAIIVPRKYNCDGVTGKKKKYNGNA